MLESSGWRILEQQTLSEIEENQGKKIHTVVKNAPFTTTVGVTVAVGKFQVLDLHSYKLEATLLYDSLEEKKVDFIKDLPLEYTSTVNETGEQAVFEIRIKVLSSQLEDMLFKIKFTAAFEGKKLLTCYSNAIKVVSKHPRPPKKIVPTLPVSSPTSSGKKRTFQQTVEEALKRIEEQQEHQKQFVKRMLEKENKPIPHTIPAPQTDMFEASFHKFIKAYNELREEEKPNKVRAVIRKTASRDVEKLTELLCEFYYGIEEFTASQQFFPFSGPSWFESTDDYS